MKRRKSQNNRRKTAAVVPFNDKQHFESNDGTTQTADRYMDRAITASGQMSERSVRISVHAIKRGQQRGISQDSIKLTARYGEPKRAVGGAIRRTMNRKAVEQMINRGFPATEISESFGTVLITKDTDHGDRVVMTVRPSERNGPTRGRQHKPKYGRHHDRPGDSLTDCRTYRC